MKTDAELMAQLRALYRSEMALYLIPEGKEDRKCVGWIPIGILREAADRLAALIAERDRLKEALERIAVRKPLEEMEPGDFAGDFDVAFSAVVEVARAALSPTQEKVDG